METPLLKVDTRAPGPMEHTTSTAMLHRQVRLAHKHPDLWVDKDVSTRFGRRLKALREQRNLTQTCMAAKFGIDRSFISDVERGKKAASLASLEIFALGFKITLSDLFRGL